MFHHPLGEYISIHGDQEPSTVEVWQSWATAIINRREESKALLIDDPEPDDDVKPNSRAQRFLASLQLALVQ